MPAPAVYIIAIVGTVGAVLAFKEFVYEPHIAPAIDKWKLEYQAARRRREAANASEGDLLMSQTETRKPDIGRSSDDADDSDDDKPLAEVGKGSNRFLKGGLLLRRQVPESQGDVELEDFVAREVNEWRNEDTGHVLRQRKNASENASENAMDESIHAIPYAPLSPSRTHVVFDPSAPSTPGSGSGSRHPSLPHSPVVTSGIDISRDNGSPKSAPRSSSPQVPSPKVASRPLSPLLPPPPPQVSPFQHSITQSMLLGTANSTTPTSASIISSSSHPLQHSYTVPSLSQSYPQDLDYEHGLELLSPPSSRSESPFSMAAMSPNPSSVTGEGLRALSPFGSESSMSASNFSSAVSSPSPLRMGLGNESFDAVSPFLDPTPHMVQGSSVTDSARSTTYLSFPDDSSEDEAGDTTHFLPPQQLGASIGVEGAFGPISLPRVGIQSPPTHSAQFYSPSNPRLSPVSRHESRTPPTAVGNPFSGSSQLMNAIISSGSRSGSLSSSSQRPSSIGGHNHHAPTHSDADLSDLDLMSDYAPSESDFGNESDSSWSMAGGSAAASPRMGNNNANATAMANVTRGGTIRDSRGGRFVKR
ncbi:hypothetical protein CVT25_003872 [Psilocybe cyanescens]|uniref:Uncharacterized protein n=1 Tax=Psilocybe cyanescens TaxID=93625 RepID=A0A409XPN0_PSICY|nr:hypothetical protein CVT25_003872 [Psilocybe cyanescens]